MKISAFYPNYYRDYGIAHASLRLIEAMQSPSHTIKLMGISSDENCRLPFFRDAIPQWSKKFAYKLMSDANIVKLSESIFYHSLKYEDYAFIWPGTSLDLYRKVKNKGYKIIYESVNTHQLTSKKILDAEYAQLGLTSSHGITDRHIETEYAMQEIADLVFCPSTLVKNSLLNAGLNQNKILDTSYGLVSSGLTVHDYINCHASNRKFTAIFVGSICVRKGAHLLLDYWVKANLDAKLILVGNIEPAIKHIVEPYLSKNNIEHVPFTFDLPAIYKNADLFVLPSLEEGSPLVTYLAMGASLPSLVSPMGGGDVVRDGVDGIVLNPHDENKWIEALKLMFNDYELRQKFSTNARKNAENYTWSIVGNKRLHALEAAFNQQSPSGQLS